jgi:FAD-linked oxidoreductase
MAVVAARWTNWAGNQVAHPLSIEAPRDIEGLSRLVEGAASRGERVKVVGSGHSFTAAAVTDGRLVRIGNLAGIRSIDRDRLRVTVGAGTTLADLNVLLAAEGLAMPNLGDIAYQTVAGAISTSTHGTGSQLPGLAAQVVGMTLVDGRGRVVTIDETENSALLPHARVSIGALGAIAEVTLQVVPAFRLRAVEQPMRLEAVLESVHDHAASNDHFEFYWIPHTKWALTKRNNRTDDPVDRMPAWREWRDKTFLENHAFGMLCRLGRARPSLIPKLATALPSSGSREWVDDSWRIFASKRLVRFYEMEHALPVAAVVPALEEIRAMVERRGHLLSFPVEVRFTAADDATLSTAHGRDSAYIAVHMFKGMDPGPYFADVEAIMREHDARPHWGKMHTRAATELSDLYPRWREFLSARDDLDPGRTFANDYTSQIFGE